MTATPYFGRVAIVDAAQELRGFALRFRDGRLDPTGFATAPPPSAAAVVERFTGLDLAGALGRFDAHLAADAAFLAEPALEALPATRIVLELQPGVVADPATLARCEALRQLSFRFAIAAVGGPGDPRAPLFPLAEMLTIEGGALAPSTLPPLLAALAAAPGVRLAGGVDAGDDFARCKAAGVQLFRGSFFARPSAAAGRKLDSSKVVLMKLLAQIMEDADTPVLEASFKQAPGLSVNLLRLVNSVASGIRVRISSLRHAITVLGRRQLQRWLQLLLYTDPAGASRLTNPLLQMAATRGRLMELLAHDVARNEAGFADHAFVCGVMSLTPALLDMPLAQILAQVNLAAPIGEALLTGHGRLGQLLAVVQAMEDEAAAGLPQALLALPMLRSEQLAEALAEALRWANHIGEEAAD